MPTGAVAGHVGSYAAAAVSWLNAHAGSRFGDDGSREGEKHRVQVLEDLRFGTPLLDLFYSTEVADDPALGSVPTSEKFFHADEALSSVLWGTPDPDALLRLVFTRAIELSLGLPFGGDTDARSRCWYIDFTIVAGQPALYATIRGVDHQDGTGHVAVTLFTPAERGAPALEVTGRVDPEWTSDQRRCFWVVADRPGSGPMVIEPEFSVGGEQPAVAQS